MDRSEKRLARIVKSYLDSTTEFGLRPRHSQCVLELRTLQGRPDIVVFSLGTPTADRRTLHKIGTAMSTHSGAAVLAVIGNVYSRTLETLLTKVPFTEQSIRRALRELEAVKLVRVGNGIVRGTPLLRSISVPLIAIEAKRTISRRALFQAKQYRSFASRSLLAVWHDGSRKELAAVANLSPSLGLIGVRRNGDIVIARKGASRKPRNRVAYYYAVGAALSRKSVRHSGFMVMKT